MVVFKVHTAGPYLDEGRVLRAHYQMYSGSERVFLPLECSWIEVLHKNKWVCVDTRLVKPTREDKTSHKTGFTLRSTEKTKRRLRFVQAAPAVTEILSSGDS